MAQSAKGKASLGLSTERKGATRIAHGAKGRRRKTVSSGQKAAIYRPLTGTTANQEAGSKAHGAKGKAIRSESRE